MVQTGIFKYPVGKIQLGASDVEKDQVIDRKYHGGIDKACYLFSADVYDYWKNQYPELEWDWGMFGENITIEGLDESQMMIGATYKIGDAIVEVSQPRQPCFKLGVRFNTQKVLKDFIAAEHSGVYVRVIKEGTVTAGDELILINQGESLSIREVFCWMYRKGASPEVIEKIQSSKKLANSSKKEAS